MAFESPKRRSLVFHGKAFYVVDDWYEKLSRIGLSEDKDWQSLQSDNQVSGSYNTTNSFRFTLKDGEAVYFKRYIYNDLRPKSWLQSSKAQTEAAGLSELKAIGIPTIDVLAYGEQRFLGFLKAAFIVTKERKNLHMMDRYTATIWHRLPFVKKQPILRRIQTILIQQLQTVHRHGFYHWDLKLRNLLLYNPESDEADIIWIDCPRSRRLSANHFPSICKDFAAMARVGSRALTRGQQFRFLLDYFDGNRSKARQLMRCVAGILEKNPPRPLWHVLDRDDPEFLRNIEIDRQQQTG